MRIIFVTPRHYIRPQQTSTDMYVEIENTRTGQRKTISQRTWDLMANSRDRGDTRKGYKLIKSGTDTPSAKAKTASVQARVPTMIPPAIQEAANAAIEAERAAEAKMMSGARGEAVAVEVAPQAAEPAAAQEVPVVQEAEAPQAEAQAHAEPVEEAKELPTELSGLDESLTPKVAQVLAAAGIATFAQLNAATLPAINKVLDAAGLGAKKAQAPGWKSKAKTRVTK